MAVSGLILKFFVTPSDLVFYTPEEPRFMLPCVRIQFPQSAPFLWCPLSVDSFLSILSIFEVQIDNSSSGDTFAQKSFGIWSLLCFCVNFLAFFLSSFRKEALAVK